MFWGYVRCERYYGLIPDKREARKCKGSPSMYGGGFLLLPPPSPLQGKSKSPSTLSGALLSAVLLWVVWLEECRQFCTDFDHTRVYGDVADLHGGGNLPLGLALNHPVENDFVLAVQTVVKVLQRCPNGGGSLGVGGSCDGIKEAVFFAAAIGGRVADYHAVPLRSAHFPLKVGFCRSADDSRQTIGKALTGPPLDLLRQFVNIQQVPGNCGISAIGCVSQLVTVGQPPPFLNCFKYAVAAEVVLLGSVLGVPLCDDLQGFGFVLVHFVRLL